MNRIIAILCGCCCALLLGFALFTPQAKLHHQSSAAYAAALSSAVDRLDNGGRAFRSATAVMMNAVTPAAAEAAGNGSRFLGGATCDAADPLCHLTTCPGAPTCDPLNPSCTPTCDPNDPNCHPTSCPQTTTCDPVSPNCLPTCNTADPACVPTSCPNQPTCQPGTLTCDPASPNCFPTCNPNDPACHPTSCPQTLTCDPAGNTCSAAQLTCDPTNPLCKFGVDHTTWGKVKEQYKK